MNRAPSRFWLLPAVTCLAAVVIGVTTSREQERQYEGVRALVEAHATLVGALVRESAQQAALATDLVFTLTAGGLYEAAGLLGPAPTSGDCDQARAKLPALRVWASRTDTGLGGCFDAVPDERRGPLFDQVAGAADPTFVDQGLARDLGLICTLHERQPPTIVCRERELLDDLRREVGLGPLLAGLRGGALLYVVLQDATGLLAASPGTITVSAWRDDPALQGVLDSTGAGVTSRIVEAAPSAPVFESLGAVRLGDGSRAVVRVGLDASELVLLRARIDARHLVMSTVLASVVALSAALAFVLARASRRRRELVAELRAREEESRHWQALGQLAATVAHEVRNPLNAIGMALQRLGSEFQVAPDERDEFAELLRVGADSADRVERVVAEFLELGRPLVLELHLFEARELLEQALAPLALRAAREGIALSLTVEGAAHVRVDRQRFGQIVGNLGSNALDAAGPGGQVRVEAACDDQAFTLRVVDDGPGMDEATLAGALTPFVTTKATGTGLGLPLARRLAEAHGGSLELTSAVGRGTVAVVRLPSSPRA